MSNKNKHTLLALADLLHENRQELARLNSVDVLTSLQTNLDNVDRAVSTLKAYAEYSFDKMVNGGTAIYSCYGDPSFGIFGLVLAPVILAGGAQHKIIIGLPGILKSYGGFLENIFRNSAILPQLEFVYGVKEFSNQLTNSQDIKNTIIFGDAWVKGFVEPLRKQKKSLTFYGPGNNAAIILPGADIEKAVEQILESAFILSGQAAVCINRCIIDSRIDVKTIQAVFNKKLKLIKTGFSVDNYVTPIAIKPLVDMVKQRVNDLQNNDLQIDGFKIDVKDEKGLVNPSLVWLENEETALWSEYHFAPVLPIVFCNYNKIGSLTNNTKYGIYVAIYGRDHEIDPLLATVEKEHILVLSNKSILDEMSINGGYTGKWGGFKNSGFHMGESTNWQLKEGAFSLLDTIVN